MRDLHSRAKGLPTFGWLRDIVYLRCCEVREWKMRLRINRRRRIHVSLRSRLRKIWATVWWGTVSMLGLLRHDFMVLDLDRWWRRKWTLMIWRGRFRLIRLRWGNIVTWKAGCGLVRMRWLAGLRWMRQTRKGLVHLHSLRGGKGILIWAFHRLRL